MTVARRNLRLRALIALGAGTLVLLAQAARAGLPPPPMSTIPTHVVLVGHGPAGPDSATGQVEVVVRDLAGNPVPGSVITFDLSAATDMRPAEDQRDPRLFTNCGALRQVSAVSDVNGIARLTILGAVTNGPPSGSGALKIYADGVLLGYPLVSALERDGVAGLTLADLSFWTADFFSGTEPMRADLDGSGYVSILDLSVWARAYFSGDNALPIGALCP